MKVGDIVQRGPEYLKVESVGNRGRVTYQVAKPAEIAAFLKAQAEKPAEPEPPTETKAEETAPQA